MEMGRDMIVSSTEVDKLYWKISKPTWLIDVSGVCGGGICIHPSGIILSVARIFAGWTQTRCNISGRCHDMDDVVSLEICEFHPDFNMSILCVVHPTRSYDYVLFSEFIDTFPGQQVFTIQHTSGLSYSLGIGTVAGPEITFSDLKDGWNVMEEKKKRREREGEQEEDAEMFVSDPKICENELQTAMTSSLPELNLIQILNVSKWAFGVFGCPVFENTGKLLGLIAYSQMGSVYAIGPSSLQEFLKKKRQVGIGTICLKGDRTELLGKDSGDFLADAESSSRRLKKLNLRSRWFFKPMRILCMVRVKARPRQVKNQDDVTGTQSAFNPDSK